MTTFLKQNLLLLLILTGLLAIFTSYAKEPKEDKIIGMWTSPLNDVIVNCFKENGKYYGKIVWYKRYHSGAPENPNGIAESTWMNTLVLKDFVFNEDEWNNGEIYDIKSGKKYTGYITMINENQMHVTGFMFFRFLSKSTYFSRYTKGTLPPFD